MAVPISTGIILAGKVFGLKASTQIFIIKYLLKSEISLKYRRKDIEKGS
jgi:hypothetical protein